MFPDLNKYKINNLKKFSFELLKERYSKYDVFLERIAHNLQTDEDYKNFMALALDLYEAGFLKCVGDQAKEFKRLGISYTVQAEKSG
jgi:hypothetical protein